MARAALPHAVANRSFTLSYRSITAAENSNVAVLSGRAESHIWWITDCPLWSAY